MRLALAQERAEIERAIRITGGELRIEDDVLRRKLRDGPDDGGIAVAPGIAALAEKSDVLSVLVDLNAKSVEFDLAPIQGLNAFVENGLDW
jgi:hypothetical protein